MSGPRNSNASLMCQYACFPAPNTTTSCTFCRFLNNIVLASAVLNAVISSAFNSARGAPLLSNSVKLPFGVVDCALERDGGGVKDLEDC